jgi:hypothetical protein
MRQKPRSSHRRRLVPSLYSLEGRLLLNAAMPLSSNQVRVPAHVSYTKHHSAQESRSHGPDITAITLTDTGGYRFTNFDGPTPGTAAGTGTNVNGIANTGTVVGFTIGNSGTLINFTADPRKSRKTTVLNINGSAMAMAFGINAAATVVGTDGQGNAFSLSRRGIVTTFIPTGGTSATALGINDQGTIVGQYVTSTAAPGFIRVRGKDYVTINAPSGPNMVNAQGINDQGLVVGFYVGADGQDHGFMVKARGMEHGTLTGTAIADPTIPHVAGETAATFVFSQVLGINDKGIAVGYYGDSTGSQHGFLYDAKTGQYTFVDDPSEAFSSGVEVTQITGITNSGEITGFYSDANGVFHGFVATPHRA